MATPADPILPAAALPPDAVSLVPIPPQRIPKAVAKLDTIIDGVLSKTGVPGLAAAVVHDGKLLYANGFGSVTSTTRPASIPAPCSTSPRSRSRCRPRWLLVRWARES